VTAPAYNFTRLADTHELLEEFGPLAEHRYLYHALTRTLAILIRGNGLNFEITSNFKSITLLKTNRIGKCKIEFLSCSFAAKTVP
jgi:hypothetical protein